jgi:long-chain fatty acid transport protein
VVTVGTGMQGRTTGPRRSLYALSLFGTGAALLFTASAPAAAAGFYLQEQSVKGWGRANSGEVADQGPASLWWNPAAIGGIGESSASFGATGFLPVGEVKDAGTLIDRPGLAPAPVGGGPLGRDPIEKGAAPNNALALRLSGRLALGLSITSPFSFTSDYDSSGWQRYSAIHTRLTTIDVQPSIAFMPVEWLSLGAGLNIEYADAFLSNALPNLAAGSGDGRLRLKGDGWDLGWSAGVQLRPSERFSLGLAYKSAIEHRLGGSVEIVGLTGALAARNLGADTTATFSTPWQLIVGARAGVTGKITLNAQAVRFGWSKFDSIALGAPLGGAIQQGYQNSWSLAFGVDDKVGKRLTLRAGIQFDGTPTRDATRDPRVPDADRVDYNVGLSFQLNGRMTFDAAAAYTDFEASTIGRDERFYAGTAAQTDVLTGGRADEQRALVFSLGGRMRL